MREEVKLKEKNFMFLTIIIEIVLVILLSRLKQVKKSVQGEIFYGAMVVIEILQCCFEGTVRIFSQNAFLSVAIMILLPFIILFAYYAISGIIAEKKKARNQNNEDSEE